jgi:hypothetical protein
MQFDLLSMSVVWTLTTISVTIFFISAKLEETVKETLLSEGFLNCIQFEQNLGARDLSAPTHKVVFSLVFRILRHPWGRVNSRDIIVLRFVFDIWQFFSLFLD